MNLFLNDSVFRFSHSNNWFQMTPFSNDFVFNSMSIFIFKQLCFRLITFEDETSLCHTVPFTITPEGNMNIARQCVAFSSFIKRFVTFNDSI